MNDGRMKTGGGGGGGGGEGTEEWWYGVSKCEEKGEKEVVRWKGKERKEIETRFNLKVSTAFIFKLAS